MIRYCKTYRLWEGLWLQSLQLWTVLQFPCWLIDWMYFRHINTESNVIWFKLEIIRCRYHICHILKSKLNVLFYQFVRLVRCDEINCIIRIKTVPITELICSVVSPNTWIGFKDLDNVKNNVFYLKAIH